MLHKTLAVSLLLCAAAAAAGDHEEAGFVKPGTKISDFRAKDQLSGIDVTLYPAPPGFRATVVVFTSSQCPVASVLAPRVVEFYKNKYREKDVRFIFVKSNASEPAEEFLKFIKNAGAEDRVIFDDDQSIADRFGAVRSSEVFVVDEKHILQYRGAVDDQYIPGARKPEPKRQFLEEALDAVLQQKTPPTIVTKAQGCLIGRERKPEKKETPVTYSQHVAPILQKHCVECHRPGEVGPMSLLNYEDAADISLMIGEVVENGRMPPWHADPQFGKWSNERKLSPAEKKTIADWVKAGAPAGELKTTDTKDTKAKDTKAAEKPGDVWHIGKPDLLLKVPKQQIPATGTIEYRYINVETGLGEDRYIQAAEVHAGARQQVHHILVFCKYPKDRKKEQPLIDGGLEGGFFASLVPGDMPNIWPDGCGKLLPAGSILMFQIHYTANGIAAEDVTEIGLRFCKEKPSKIVTTRGITQRRLNIAPHDPAALYTASWNVPKNIQILAMSPHMHFRGKSFRFDVTAGDKTETILSVPKYDFNWQAVYRPASPLLIQKGSVIKCEGVYDNSAANPANPNPNATVRFGEQSWEEMFIGYVDYIEK